MSDSGVVQCHSWLACTDYAEKGGAVWKPGKCRAFARHGHYYTPKNGEFGYDRNFNYIPKEYMPCRTARNDTDAYTRAHPMAVYYPGQQVVLVHPMKNHGADASCGNIYIPDRGSWVYRSELNAQSDPLLSDFKKNLVSDLGRSPYGSDFLGREHLSSVYPKPGYQNAPNFCKNTDKAMATYSMNVPKDLKPGRYTFMWLWAFNSLEESYGTCYEVQIVPNKQIRNTWLRRRGIWDKTEPCGGMTSNPNIKGNRNLGCTPTRPHTYQKSVVRSQLTSAKNKRPRNFPRREAKKPILKLPSQQNEKNKALTLSVELNMELRTKLTYYTGEIEAPSPRTSAVRRHYSVDFGCPVLSANFPNSKMTNDVNSKNTPRRHYELMQEGGDVLTNKKITFQVLHTVSCDIVRHPPRAKLLREEYKNA